MRRSHVVGDGVVLHRAVVPERDRARLPVEPALELRRAHVVEQERQEHLVLAVGEAHDVRRGVAVHEQRLATGLGMRDHDLCSTGGHFCCIVGEVERRVTVADRLAAAALVMSWTARQAVDETRASRARGASYAAYMLAKHVSPPTAGQLHRAQDRAHRRVGEERVVAVPLVGALALRVHLVEHDDRRARPGGRSASGDTCIGPKRSANARCCSSVICWSRKKSDEVVEERLAEHLARRRRRAGSRRSTPCTSAPMVAVSGGSRWSTLVLPVRRAWRLGGCPDILSFLRILGKEYLDGRRLRCPAARGSRHLDDLPWQEVRRQQHGDHTASVREKWLDFSPGSSRCTRSGTRG